MQILLRFFFHQLYHRFAWCYDAVAWVVSLGRWNKWCQAIIPLLPPGRILEIGSGPGHLLQNISLTGRSIIGLDESWQMNCQAKKRYPAQKFLRAYAEMAPFATASLDVIVASFPAPYIFEAPTANEMARILSSKGQLLALLAARPVGQTLADQFIRALFLLTGETPRAGFDYSGLFDAYRKAGFQVIYAWSSHPGAELLIMTCVKQASSGQ
jgi:ubiquinone/menaquinone biosynthesis C-methylase UbiE